MSEVLVLLKEVNPAIALPVFVVMLIGWVLGYPALRARRDGVVQSEKARKAKAEADGEAADADGKQFRRQDGAADIFEARWKRALSEADTEREGRLAALALVQAAREDVHTAANAAQLQLSSVETSAKAEIQRITNACEARIFDLQQTASVQLTELRARVELQDQLIEALTSQNRACEDTNLRLSEESAKLKERIVDLEAWQHRSDIQGNAQ